MCAFTQIRARPFARIGASSLEPVMLMKESACLLITVAILAFSSLPAAAHPPMQHGCIAPERPADDQNDLLWGQFLEEINEFQTCISQSADRHQAASDEHQRAAFAAVDAWNDFVHSSLNAPEDFPWPPDEN